MKKLLAVLLCLGLVGCFSMGVIKISPDTYMVSKTGVGGFSNTVDLKGDVFYQANDFAASQGKIAIPLSVKEERYIPFLRAPRVELQFRVVDKNDPEARRASLVPRPDIVIDKTERVSADIHSKVITVKQPDLYTELTKLDDLRKKGILTEDEFQAQKKLLLEKQQ